jgi:protoporphyrinogen oxidase
LDHVIGIVGGGLAGLVAAYELTRAGNPVTLIEGAQRLGGQIRTESVDGFIIEHGAEGYAAGRRPVNRLVADLGITGRLVSQITTSSAILRGGRLETIPVSEAARLTGIQADPADFGPGIASFSRGAEELIGALVAALGHRATLRLGAEAVHLTPKAGGWRLTTGQRDAVDVDGVILAVPPAAAAGLVAPISKRAAELLESFPAVSSVSVSLACAATAVRLPPEAGGFVSAAGGEPEGFRACEFSSAKFPARAPSGFVLLRAFFRPGRECPLDAPDTRWVKLAMDSIWPALGIRERPARAWVARWPRALPRYAPDHEESLRTLVRLLGVGAPLELAGAAYRPSGIAGALESAQAAARGLVLENA